MINDRPDLEKVQKHFFAHWPLINTLGVINYMCLHEAVFYPDTSEEVFAFYLLGAVRMFDFTEEGSNAQPEQAWERVQFLIEDLLPDTAQVKYPDVKIDFREVGKA
jgi:hypothetical protein